MLSLKRIGKSYNGTMVLRGIDLDVEQGEFFAIVGPSGCGKSTLLRIVAGLDRPDHGVISFDGVDVTDWEPLDRGVGMVFQTYALYPHLTAAANIGFGLKGRVPRRELDRRVAEVADLLQLDQGVLRRRPRQLSGGQRQRVAIGRALIRRPRLLLMDEPLSGADALLRERMRSELRRLHDQTGTTTLYVTHDQREAMSMSDRLLVLDDGSTQQIGAPIDVYRQPQTEFVARFLGTPGMSLWPMQVRTSGGAATLVGANGETWTLHEDVPDGATVTVGVRPERLSLARRPSDDCRLTCRWSSVEHQGEQSLLHLRHGQAEIVAVVPPDAAGGLEPEIDIWCSRQDLHLFHADTGERVEARPPVEGATGRLERMEGR